MLATDNLGVASTYVYHMYKQYGTPMAVWQPRTQGYREYYRDWDDNGDSTKGVMSAIRNFLKGML